MADNGTLKLWEKLKPLIDAEISKQTRSCCRMKSMVVSSSYDETTKTVSVQEAFGAAISVPVYGTVDVEKLTVGTPVWVLSPYSAMSNAMVFMLGDIGQAIGSTAAEVDIATTTSAGIVQIGENLKVNEAGVVSVDTATECEGDNTKPITSAAVHTVVGNVETILSTI